MQASAVQKLTRMIAEFERLHLVSSKAEPTFMQLTDYPHSENVCSNVLAFFLNTEECHGFGSLFIKSLLECAGKDSHCYATEAVEREMTTDIGNRIDIFIETDKYLIAIENKLYSNINNPLGDYRAHVSGLSGMSEKSPLLILLTLKEEKTDEPAFVNITYSELFAMVKKNMGTYIVSASTKWIVMLNDFIRTMDELRDGTALDGEFISFYNEHEESILALMEAQKNLSRAMKAKLKAVTSLLLFCRKPSKEYWYASKNECYAEYNLTYDNIKSIGAQLSLSIYIDTGECAILIGVNDGNNNQMRLLEKLLIYNGLGHSRWEANSNYILVKRLKVFEADEVVAREFQMLLNVVNNEALYSN